MAIDNRNKRQSAMSEGSIPVVLAHPVADATIDARDRRHMACIYRGFNTSGAGGGGAGGGAGVGAMGGGVTGSTGFGPSYGGLWGR